MTRGRRGEKTYTGHNGAATDALRALDAQRKSPPGIAGRVAAPSPEAVQAFITEGRCPYCSGGPFTVLAQHTQRVHGVGAAELRVEAGLTKNARICDVAFGEAIAERRRGRALPPSAYRPKPKRVYSEAGLAAQRSKLEVARSPEQARRAGEAAGRRTLERNAEKHTEIERLWDQTPLSYEEIGQRVGMHPRSVRESLRRAGRNLGDGRRVRWERSRHG